MKLDIVGEVHPTNIVLGLFSRSHLGSEVDERVISYFRPNSRVSPFFVTNDEFWNSLYNLVRSKSQGDRREGHEILVVPSVLGGRDSRELSDLMIRQLEIVRNIWGEEAYLLAQRQYKTALIEGDMAFPLDRIALSRGKRVVALDENSPVYHLLLGNSYGAESYHDLQSEREAAWVEKTLSRGDGLMICGDDHQMGKFGLRNRLSIKGIEVRLVKSFRHYEKEVIENFKEIRRIKSCLV